MAAAFLFVAVLLSGVAAASDLPDSATTAGVAASDVTQNNIKSTICIPGFTKSPRRPPASYTSALKRQQLAALGGDQDPQDFEEDHLIPLELGGDPRDPGNLWPQHYSGPWGARTKDRLERRLHYLVCAGVIPLAEAQRAIATDWIAAYRLYCPTEQGCRAYRSR